MNKIGTKKWGQSPKSGTVPIFKRKGFTLIELTVVLIVLGILFAVAYVLIGNRLTKARETALKQNLYILRKTIDDFYADKHKYPSTLNELVKEKYIRSIPIDPLTKVDDWVCIPSEKGNDVYDVKSNSSATGVDGKAYKDY